MQVFYKPDAINATARVLREMQDWQPGDALKAETEEVLQALCLRPYVGNERNTSGGGMRPVPTVRTVVLEADIENVPSYDMGQGGKFS